MSTNPPTFLGLPREMRDHIYTELFRSLTFSSADPQHRCEGSACNTGLAILFANHQIHAEASPLVLRYARFHCSDIKDMLRFLMSLSPMQIGKLRHLRVGWTSFCLQQASSQKPFTAPEHFPFSISTALQLFPGLQLDLLELYQLPQAAENRDTRGLELINHLLKTEGFREVQVFLSRPLCLLPNSWDAHRILQTFASWKSVIRARFRPRPGGSVDLFIGENADDNCWTRYKSAGFTLWKNTYVRGALQSDGTKNESWNIRVRRGRGPCVVHDDQVLNSAGTPSLGPRKVREVSDHLRWLFKKSNRSLVSQVGLGFDLTIDGNFR